MILILGWQMQKVAVGWEIYERTHSAIYLGYAGMIQFLPQVLFMLFAGHVVDTYNRKRVYMMALACNAAAAAGLAVNSARGGSIYVLYGCLFAYGTARAFIMPSRAAFLPGIVPLEIFSTAFSWQTSGFEVSSMTGPAIGGPSPRLFQRPNPVSTIYATRPFLIVMLVAGLPFST